MSKINFEFATKDDCLQKMMPSDLRVIISERDRLRDEKAELLEALQSLLTIVENNWLDEYWDEGGNTHYYNEWTGYDKYRDIISKAKR